MILNSAQSALVGVLSGAIMSRVAGPCPTPAIIVGLVVLFFMWAFS